MSGAGSKQGSLAEAGRFLSVLWEPGDVRELRIPRHNKYGHTASGYFDDRTKLLASLARWDGNASIYVTLNPVLPALLARANNRIVARAEKATADLQITRRRWLLLDIDPARPSGISSTDQELALAHDLLRRVVAHLDALGWPEPVLAMSGNGAYALYRVHLPNDAEVLELIKSVLLALAERFDTDAAHVDTTVSNAARLVGLVGTRKVKGDPLPDRPHRRSHLVSAPNELGPVSLDLLKAVAAEASNRGSTAVGGASLARMLDAQGIEYRENPPDAQGFSWYHVRRCPYHADGRPFECGVGQRLPNGPLAGKCFHPEGESKSWKEWKAALGLKGRSEQPFGHGQYEAGAGPYIARNLDELLAAEDEPLDVVIADEAEGGILTADGKGMVSGPTGIGKTNLLLRMGRSLSEGTPFLGFAVPQPRRVVHLALEGSPAAVKRRLRKLWAGCSSPEARQRFHLAHIQLNLAEYADVERLDDLLYSVRPDVLIIDPLRNAHPWDENRSDEMSRLTAILDGIILRHGCAIICAHHDRKKPPFTRSDAGTDRVRGSTALTGWMSFCLSIDADVTKDRMVLTWTKTRDAEDALDSIVVDFDRESMDFVVNDAVGPQGKVSDDAILTAVFREGQQGVRGTDLFQGFVEGAGVSDRWIRERVRKLVEAKGLEEFIPAEEKKGAKWYRIPGSVEA